MNKKLTEFIDLLKTYVGFKSISTELDFKDAMIKTAEFLQLYLSSAGFSVQLLQGPTTNPVVFASYHQSDEMNTIMVYGHYDVQPASIEKGWKEDPFILRIEEDRLIGRGVMDNKAQNLMHIFTVIKLIEEKKLNCNVKFLIEGNEETSNPDMADLVLKYKDLLACDEIIVSDGEVVGNTPSIEETLRGGGNITLTFKTANGNVHSGVFGSGIPNSAKEMVLFLGNLMKTDGFVTIPGFYDAVDEISQEKIESNIALLEIENPLDISGAKKMIGEFDFHSTVGLRPALEISGIIGGYTEKDSYANIIPAETTVKINVRLVASQTPTAFEEMFRAYVKENVPDHVDYTISMTKMSPPVKVDIHTERIKKIMVWLEQVYGNKPIVKNVGGGIPIVADFKSILGVDAILIPLGGNDSNMHGAEENMRMELIEKGLALSELLFS